MARITIVQNGDREYDRTPKGWVAYTLGPNHQQKTPTTWKEVRKAITPTATIIKAPTTTELLAAADATRDLQVYEVGVVEARMNRAEARQEYRQAQIVKPFDEWCADNEITGLKAGWYYAFGEPGCLFDSTPYGPYPSERAAKLAAARDHDLGWED